MTTAPAFKLVELTETDAFKSYARDAALRTGVHLANCVAAGLPSVWMYMKAIGQEEKFFELLQQAQQRPHLYKELMYLLQLTNAQSDYFEKLPEDFLNLEIPGLVADAIVAPSNPDFKLTFALTGERLLELLRSLAVPNRMIRLGTREHSIGVMFSNGTYSVYHAGNTKALEYTKLADCVAAVVKMQPKSKTQTAEVVVMEAFNLSGMPVPKPPIALELFAKYCKTYTPAERDECLFACVLANDLKALQHLQSIGVPFTATKFGIDLLRLAVVQPKPNLEIIKFLMAAKVDSRAAIEELIALKAQRPKDKQLDTIRQALQAGSSPQFYSPAAKSVWHLPTKKP
jgi:hypothetical protein